MEEYRCPYCGSKIDKQKYLVASIKHKLSPIWILDCVMYDKKHNALVVSPKHCLEHGVTVLQVSQDGFGSKTILHFRLDYNIKKVKKT